MRDGQKAFIGSGAPRSYGKRRHDGAAPGPCPSPARAGQALAEFTILAVAVVLLLVGLFEFSRHFYVRLTVRHSVAEAARLASTGRTLEDPESGLDMTRAESIVHVILRTAQGLPVEVEDIQLDPSDGGGPGDLVRIQARFRFYFGLGRLIRGFAPASIPFTVATTVKNEPRF